VHHKVPIELLWVLTKKRFRTPDLIGGFSLKTKQCLSQNTPCCQASGLRHWLAYSVATDAGQYGRNFTWTAGIDDLWSGCLLSEGHDPCLLGNRNVHGETWYRLVASTWQASGRNFMKS